MRKKKSKMGHVRHRHKVALLVIDMLNTLQFSGSGKLLRYALPAARAIARLKKKLKIAKIPIIYVNDNFGLWRSDWRTVFETCSSKKSKGAQLSQILEPLEDDYFVLKPKHSGFYSTTLDVLLESLGAETLIMTGIAANICVLFTVNDAHMREYKVIVPRDCVASNTKADTRYAIRQIRDVFGFQTCLSTAIKF